MPGKWRRERAQRATWEALSLWENVGCGSQEGWLQEGDAGRGLYWPAAGLCFPGSILSLLLPAHFKEEDGMGRKKEEFLLEPATWSLWVILISQVSVSLCWEEVGLEWFP